MRFHPLRRAVLSGLCVLALAACNDEPDFGFGDWTATVDTVTLYSADIPEYQSLPAAYDIRATRFVRIEDAGATGNWDFVLTGGAGDALTLTPLGAFFDLTSNAGLTTATGTFEELERAPSEDDAYVTDEAVTLTGDVLYVVRSRASGNCMNFAKVEPLGIDQEEGTFRFRVTANPQCNNTRLVPPGDD